VNSLSLTHAKSQDRKRLFRGGEEHPMLRELINGKYAAIVRER
jgi:hypothetical protein